MEWVLVAIMYAYGTHTGREPSSITLRFKTEESCEKVGRKFVSFVQEKSNATGRYVCINISEGK